MKRFLLSASCAIFISAIPVFLYWTAGGNFDRNVGLFFASLFSSVLLVGVFVLMFVTPWWGDK